MNHGIGHLESSDGKLNRSFTNKKEKSMNTLDANAHYSGFVAARNSETAIRWQKVQIFFLINSVLLGVVTSAALPEKLRILIGIFGLTVTIIWWLIQWEAQNAVDFWNGKIASLEKENKAIVSGFSFEKPREGFRFRFVSTHYMILALIKLFGIGWISLLVYYCSA